MVDVPQAQDQKRAPCNATDQRVPLVGRALEVVSRRMHQVSEAGGSLFPARSATGHALQNGIQSAVHWRQPYSRTQKHI